MINIIGLGEMGCDLADEFAKHDTYDIYKIGIGLPKNKHEDLRKKRLLRSMKRIVHR